MTHSHRFLAAVEAHDFTGAAKALNDYICWFQGAPRDLAEIEAAQQVIARGLRLTATYRAHLAEHLMLLTRLAAAYGPMKTTHTWRIQG